MTAGSRRIRLALLQVPARAGRHEASVAVAEEYIRRAARRRVDLMALPECFAGTPHGYCERLGGPVFRRFSALAARYRVHLVLGTIGEQVGRTVYNTACLVDDGGRLVGSYRKRFLWWAERDAHVAPGRKAPVFETRLGRIGLAICWDLAFPEHFRDLALGGAELVVCPAYWKAGDRFGRLGRKAGRRAAPFTRAEDFFVNSCVGARAAENSVAIAFVNAAGRTRSGGRSDQVVGLSQVVSPLKGVVARARDEPGIVVGEVDLDLVADAERIYGTKGDARALRKKAARR